MSKGPVEVEARAILSVAPGVQYLEFLPEVGGVQQLEQGQLLRAETRGFRGGGGGDVTAGVADQKRLLGLDGRGGETVARERLRQPSGSRTIRNPLRACPASPCRNGRARTGAACWTRSPARSPRSRNAVRAMCKHRRSRSKSSSSRSPNNAMPPLSDRLPHSLIPA